VEARIARIAGAPVGSPSPARRIPATEAWRLPPLQATESDPPSSLRRSAAVAPAWLTLGGTGSDRDGTNRALRRHALAAARLIGSRRRGPGAADVPLCAMEIAQ